LAKTDQQRITDTLNFLQNTTLVRWQAQNYSYAAPLRDTSQCCIVTHGGRS